MPDSKGMVSRAERATWGVLGRPPRGWEQASSELIAAWKRLSAEAKAVGRLPRAKRLDKAKEIQSTRALLVESIEKYLMARSIS